MSKQKIIKTQIIEFKLKLFSYQEPTKQNWMEQL